MPHIQSPTRCSPLFKLGRIIMTPGAIELLAHAGHDPLEFIRRHARLDRGLLCEDDYTANVRALTTGARILSAFQTRTGEKIWLITEFDRSATTILLPDEY